MNKSLQRKMFIGFAVIICLGFLSAIVCTVLKCLNVF
jgi:hypothetical protein